MIQVQDVTKAFAGKKLFESVSTTFSPGRRYGLTGPNGAGKTTFMKILAGELDPDTGTVSRPKRFSVLKQDQYAYEDRKVLDVVLMGNAALWEAMQEKERLLAKPDLTDEDGARLGELEGVIAEEDGYSAEAQAATLSPRVTRPEKPVKSGLSKRLLRPSTVRVCFPLGRFCSSLMNGRAMFDFFRSASESFSSCLIRLCTWEARVPAEKRATNSWSCARFFILSAFSDSIRLRTCPLARTMSS